MLDPQIVLMHSLLAANDSSCDVSKLLKASVGTERRLHITEMWKGCQPGGMFHEMLVKVFARLHCVDLWSDCAHTEAVATEIFKASMRSICVAYYLCVLYLRDFPSKLFMLLHDQSHVHDILRTYIEQPCLLDPWSLEFLKKHDSEAALLSPTSLATLHIIAMNLTTNTFHVECLHSKHSLRARQRSTHAMSLPQLALWQMGVAGPDWLLQVQDRLTCGIVSGCKLSC